MSFDHGGDWAGYYEKHGTLPLDFSASISPLGLPAGVREAVVRALDHADRYPDPFCRELRAALGERYGVPHEWILCGNGAGDLIERAVLALRPKRALVTAPTFSEYPAALRRSGCAVTEHFLLPQNGFRLERCPACGADSATWAVDATTMRCGCGHAGEARDA